METVTLAGKIIAHGSDWSVAIADKFFAGDRKACNKFMKDVLVADGMYTVEQHAGQGNWYALTSKGKAIRAIS